MSDLDLFSVVRLGDRVNATLPKVKIGLIETVYRGRRGSHVPDESYISTCMKPVAFMCFSEHRVRKAEIRSSEKKTS